ncbi:hypothetical protein ACFP2T_15365 [Plantactinospora solaniradicis]|uniref:Uncharacterized protein n=1 Tax=Plantactinospora solaniradicis TaxID=1723736 RepID=A0ABW1K8N2_9ACTN
MTVKTFTADEMTELLALVFWSGRHGFDEDVAEMRHSWTVHADPRQTYEQRVQRRLLQMEQCAERNPAATWRGRYPGGPVDFETGRLARRLERAA